MRDVSDRQGASAPVTVVILTFNEERNIARALDSVVGWADEVHVVDSFSTDGTLAICRSFSGVSVVQHEFEDYGRQWNWALSHLPIETEWVMKLDADERLTPELRRQIEQAVSGASPEVGAFALWRKFLFMGRWLKHSVGKCYDVRLWRSGRARFEDRSVNEHLLVEGQVERLSRPLVHEDRKGLSAWVWRHNRYSTLEAEEFFRRREAEPPKVAGKGAALRRFLKSRIWPCVPLKPLVYFVYIYLFRLGLLDGRAGLTYATLRCFYYYLIELKKEERRRNGEVSSQEAMTRRPRSPAMRAN